MSLLLFSTNTHAQCNCTSAKTTEMKNLLAQTRLFDFATGTQYCSACKSVFGLERPHNPAPLACASPDHRFLAVSVRAAYIAKANWVVTAPRETTKFPHTGLLPALVLFVFSLSSRIYLHLRKDCY